MIKKIGFSGFGNMATAIISAIIKADIFAKSDIYVFDTQVEKLETAKAFGINFIKSNVDLVNTCDLIVLAVKPQIMSDVLAEIAPLSSGKAFVSIAAGITTDKMKAFLKDSNVIRVLPNTPMTVLSGATVVATPSEDVPDDLIALVKRIFSACGIVAELSEDKINEIIPVSSSSPAFFFRIIRAMVESAQKHGIDEKTALSLAVSTMAGVCDLIETTGKDLNQLIAEVSSPNGTTVAGLSAFDDFGFEAFMDAVFDRTIHRAYELGKG